MRSAKGALSLALVLSCAPNVGDPGESMHFNVRFPNIRLDRITSQFHMRVFPPNGLRCDSNSGRIVTAMGAPAVGMIGGQDIEPHLRCDAGVWQSMMGSHNPATVNPVDVCFAVSTNQRVQVPAGQYLVLLEGSGQVMTVGGGTMNGLIATGCGTANVMAGQTADVAIIMREVTGGMGRCGNAMVEADESCDETSDNCERCQYPERTVNEPSRGVGRAPSITWATNSPLVVGFQAGTADADAWVRFFQPDGRPLAMPAFLVAQYLLQPSSRGINEHVMVASNDSTFGAVWQSTQLSRVTYDATFNMFDSYQPTMPPAVATAHPMRGGSNRRMPTMAMNGTSVLMAWVDDADNTLHVSRTTTASPPAMPSAETRPVMGMPAGTSVNEPRAVAVSGGFVVAWVAGTAGALDIYAQRFDMMGAAQGMAVRANDVPQMDQDQVAIGANGDRVVIAWRDGSHEAIGDTDGTTIRWRRFNAMLQPTDMREGLAPTSAMGDQNNPAVSVSPSGRVLIAWSNAADGFIRGRYFDFASGSSAASRLGNTTSDFRIDDPLQGGGARLVPAITYGGVGRFAVAWEQMNPASGQPSEVHMRLLRDD